MILSIRRVDPGRFPSLFSLFAPVLLPHLPHYSPASAPSPRRGGQVNSFTPPGLVLLETRYPRLAPWATVLRRSAPGEDDSSAVRWVGTRREWRLQRLRIIFLRRSQGFAPAVALRAMARRVASAWAGMNDAVGVAKSVRSGPPRGHSLLAAMRVRASFRGMSYRTVEVEIDHGRVLPKGAPPPRRGGQVNSFAPPGLVLLESWYPWLAPWATV